MFVCFSGLCYSYGYLINRFLYTLSIQWIVLYEPLRSVNPTLCLLVLVLHLMYFALFFYVALIIYDIFLPHPTYSSFLNLITN